jgi:hypothetical protein
MPGRNDVCVQRAQAQLQADLRTANRFPKTGQSLAATAAAYARYFVALRVCSFQPK